MLMEWIRRKYRAFSGQLETFFFTEKLIAHE
jgi:hypothetical protein